MSRTVRRKNGNRKHGRAGWWIPGGFKIAGYYTECDYRWVNGGTIFTYREPTKAERYQKWKMLHGESSNGNSISPGKEYRKARMKENRSINKQELVKWKKDPDNYEPMLEPNPRSCWWDWD